MSYKPFHFETQVFFVDMLGEFALRLGDFWHVIDYERRHELIARGGSASGGSSSRGNNGRGRGNARRRGPSPAAIREAKAALLSVEKSAKARARRAEREIARTAREIIYRGRFFGRAAAARLRAQQREIERQARADIREAARARRALVKFLTPPRKRTAYERRVVSDVTRQVARGERPSIARALQSERSRIASLSDAQAIAEAKLRLRQEFPNSENYDNSFAALDYLPDLARILLTLSDRALWALVRANPKNDPAVFNKALARLTKQEPLSLPVLVTGNPLFYHGEASRVQYGI